MATTYELKTVTLRAVEATGPSISDSGMLEKLARSAIEDLDGDQEHFVLIAFNSVLAPIGVKVMSSGGMDSAFVDSRRVFRAALLMGAAAIAVAHNHPSGGPTPSGADRNVTNQLIAGASTLELRFVDHIVLGRDSIYSFNEHGEAG